MPATRSHNTAPGPAIPSTPRRSQSPPRAQTDGFRLGRLADAVAELDDLTKAEALKIVNSRIRDLVEELAPPCTHQVKAPFIGPLMSHGLKDYRDAGRFYKVVCIFFEIVNRFECGF
jgi:hypothetical protein